MGGGNLSKRKLKPKLRNCKYEKCQKKFEISEDNPQQEYCSTECWKKSHDLE